MSMVMRFHPNAVVSMRKPTYEMVRDFIVWQNRREPELGVDLGLIRLRLGIRSNAELFHTVDNLDLITSTLRCSDVIHAAGDWVVSLGTGLLKVILSATA